MNEIKIHITYDVHTGDTLPRDHAQPHCLPRYHPCDVMMTGYEIAALIFMGI